MDLKARGIREKLIEGLTLEGGPSLRRIDQYGVPIRTPVAAHAGTGLTQELTENRMWGRWHVHRRHYTVASDTLKTNAKGGCHIGMRPFVVRSKVDSFW